MARLGKAGYGWACRGRARLAWQGSARQGRACGGTASSGAARQEQGWRGAAAPGAVGKGEVGPGEVRQARTSPRSSSTGKDERGRSAFHARPSRRRDPARRAAYRFAYRFQSPKKIAKITPAKRPAPIAKAV